MTEDSRLEQDPEIWNQRFLQAVSQLTEWSKHLITIAAGVLVLGATLLKDVVADAAPGFRLLIVITLACSYGLLLASIWSGLEFQRYAAGTILSAAKALGPGQELDELKRRLRRTQGLFLAGIICFGILAAFAFASWSYAS